MEGITKAKQDVETAEFVKPGLLQTLPLPAVLTHLDSDGLVELEKGLVRRLDSCLLPAVVILFLMNILDRFVIIP
jgi:hypothetical protein